MGKAGQQVGGNTAPPAMAVEEAVVEPAVEAAAIEESPLVVDEEPLETVTIETAPANGEQFKSQAERDLAILIAATEIKQDSERFRAARAIAGSAVIV